LKEIEKDMPDNLKTTPHVEQEKYKIFFNIMINILSNIREIFLMREKLIKFGIFETKIPII